MVQANTLTKFAWLNIVELLYYQGHWAISEYPSVSIVGTREPSSDGLRDAKNSSEALISAKQDCSGIWVSKRN